jgi:hypothetical protein
LTRRRPLTSARLIAQAIRSLARSGLATREDLRLIRDAVDQLDRSVRIVEAWGRPPHWLDQLPLEH